VGLGIGAVVKETGCQVEEAPLCTYEIRIIHQAFCCDAR
jgi:hypothetical protein